MSPTIDPGENAADRDETVHAAAVAAAVVVAANGPCPSCGSPRHVGRHGWTCARCALGTALNVDLDSPRDGETEQDSATSGRFFDHYELARNPAGEPLELGRGAMGITYKAHDLNLRCPVALKVIHRHLLHEPAVRERFVREARAAAGLKHPNVAAVHHLGTRGEEWFFAMEFIEGETLEAVVNRRGPLGAAEALGIITQVARALAAADRMGLVHRDIKPANLMMANDPGTGVGPGTWLVKVIDFGVARSAAVAAAGGAELTGGLLVGTPSFASPEQLRGETTDFRSDLYSLGVTLWWSLLGRPPFQGDSFQVVGQHLSKSPPFRELTTAGVPAPVVALLQAMLEKKPSARPQTPAALLEMLTGVAAALPAPAGDTATRDHRDHSARRDRPRLSPLSRASATRWGTRARRRLHRWAPAAGVALAVVGIWLALRREGSSRPVGGTAATASVTVPVEARSAAATIRSLAVLPFRRAGGGGEWEGLLTDGLADDVISRLSKLDGLKVISLASSATFRDSPLAPGVIAERLGVRGLLLGWIRQAADGQLTIHAELVDAPDNGRVLWSETYGHLRPDDLARVQGRLGEDIASTLRLTLSPAKEAALVRPVTENALAYDRYLRGRAFYQRYTPADLERAAGFFQQALEFDPKFALAYAALAETYGQQSFEDGSRSKLEQALTVAQEGVRLDPKSPETHRALGYLLYLKNQMVDCLQSCQRALDLDPNFPKALTLAGAAWRSLGRLDKALLYLRQASSRNPLDARGLIILGETLSLLDDTAGAETAFRQALNLQLDHGEAHRSLANLRLLEGNAVAAREELRLARAQSGESSFGLYLGAMVEFFDGQDAAAEVAYRRLLAAGGDRGLEYYEAVSVRSALGLLRARAGDTTEAGRFLDEAAGTDETTIHQSSDQAKALYDLAAVCAIQGHGDEAVVNLQRASAAGWCYHRATRRDPRFASVAADGRFQGLLKEWQTQVEQMRRTAESTH